MKKQQSEEDIPPFLQDLKSGGDGFKLPEGYFDDMENAVFARLKSAGDLERPNVRAKKRPMMLVSFIRPKAAMAYAAALALVLAAVWFVRQSVQELPESTVASTELSEEDLEAYVLENAHEFEPEQLASLAQEPADESLEELPESPSKKGKKATQDIHPDDLEQILDEMTDEELEQIL